jgi:hypothetical protein
VKELLVGNFKLGLHNVRLYANPDGIGGHVDILPQDQGPSKIVIGINDPNWADVQGTLLHEIYEAVFIDLNVRFGKRPSFSEEASNFLFVMTHNEFDEAHSRVSWFLKSAFEPFKKMYLKIQRDKKRKKK